MDTTLFMQRALQLAQYGFGQVAPNPMVGCVIVHQNQIIGEGYHAQYGHAHAEVNAVKDAQKRFPNPEILAKCLIESTFFVTLEPCSHFGKTPPCATLLADIKPKKVIICNVDSNPLVAGKGIAQLQQAGIEVEVGLLAEKGRILNKRFFTFMEKKRPYIALKWAESKDGFIAPDTNIRTPLSGQLAQYITHKWRTEEQGIMIGTNTALIDNPQLNARLWTGNNPTRIIIDKDLEIPENYKIFDTEAQTFVFYLEKNTTTKKAFLQDKIQKIKNQNIESMVNFVPLHLEQNEKDIRNSILPQILDYLYEQKIQSILVEGGSFLLNDFIQQGLWDDIRIWKTNKILRNGIKSPTLPNIPNEILDIEDDKLFYLIPP